MKKIVNQYDHIKPGLYIIATPIGNLDDITYRAVKILEKVDFLLAEDTRKAKQLFDFLGIRYPSEGFLSFNEKNENKNLPKIMNKTNEFSIVGFICDAGTPCISDPGIILINEFNKKFFSIVPVPGVSALTTAMSICGFKFDQKSPAIFWGFAPSKKNKRISFFKKIIALSNIAVVFESPHRADASLADCLDVFGSSCKLFVGRELTKKFETLWWGNLSDYLKFRKDRSSENPKALLGEYVFVFDFSLTKQKDSKEEDVELWVSTLVKYVKPTDLATLISKNFDVPKKLVYKKILEA